jgi:VirE N-terminal domain/Primase C terminal 1 (PriCT-1)
MENIKMSMYKSIYSKDPYTVSLSTVIERIKNEKTIDTIQKIRSIENHNEKNDVKKTLPIICFSGIFAGERRSENLIKHSGLIILDFDKVKTDVEVKKKELMLNNFVLASFVSPSGDGVKAIVKIKDPEKHSEHYLSLLKDFPDADKSTKDVCRACFDCSDRYILINHNCVDYTKILKTEKITFNERIEFNTDVQSDFDKLCKWLENKNDVFQSGNRNNFIFNLAGACCRFGIDIITAEHLISYTYLSKDSDFTLSEMKTAMRSAYKKNVQGSAKFDNGRLVEKTTLQEVTIDLCEAVKDVIYGKDVKTDSLNIYKKGYESAEKWGLGLIDSIWKPKRGEITCITGIGNYGKSAFLNYLLLCKSLKDKSKWAVFSPESYPAHEFYHSLVEVFIGCNCTPYNYDGSLNQNRPSEKEYETAYNYISDHFFYVFPKDTSPTPEYIQSVFLELIIKEKCDGCIIDPFNQLENDYKGGRDDRYLTTFLSDCKNFANINNVFFFIVAHPKQMQKNLTGNYPEPDVYDLAGGAMWNNKMDNIVVFHRPEFNSEDLESRNSCKVITRKIKRQNIVGKRGDVLFQYNSNSKQFDFDDSPLKTQVKQSLDMETKEFKIEILNYDSNGNMMPNKDTEIPF